MRGATTYRRIMAILLVSFLSLPALASAKPEIIRGGTLGLNSLDKMKPNGEYVIEVLKGDRWQEAGRLSFDKYYRERAIDLAKFIDDGNEPLKIRLTEKGGGAAHIDSIFLGELPPSDAREFNVGAWHAMPLRKISKRDHDVIDAFGKTLEFTFPAVNARASHELPLRLTARVESTTISQVPFQYPLQNLYRPMNEHSEFYSYKLDSVKGGLKVDGRTEEVTADKPFFREFSRTGSGHPSGYTYGCVRNDEENLYVSMDFTADNTMDGGKDYAKVYVKTGTGLKEFKVSVPETRWGLPDFTYTDKVPYEHKVYKFRIPLRELGITKEATPGELQLAFAAYGTASAGDFTPALAYDQVNNRFLAVFQRIIPGAPAVLEICGQLLNPDGSSFGLEFVISNAASSRTNPSVAYDSANERFLVTWEDYRSGVDNPDIYGQMVRASDGALFNHTQPGEPYNPAGSAGANFVISDAAAWKINSSVGYDSANQRFLVVWEDQRGGDFDVYGQMVRASDGALFNHAQPGNPYDPVGSAAANFVVSNATSSQSSPSAAYDDANQRFLVVWRDLRSGSDIYGQLVRASDGALFNHAQPGNPYDPAGSAGVNFVISNATGSQSSASAAYDGDNQRFLVAWSDNRGGAFDIYGQLVRASDAALFNHEQPGNPYDPAGSAGVNFVISNAVSAQYDPSVAYDSANQRFLAAWDDGNFDIFGQLVNSDGYLHDTASNVNFLIAADADSQNNPVVAFNSNCGNFLTIFETTVSGVYDIGLAVVGPPCCAPPPSGMVSWWGGDNNALDMVGGHDGSLMGNAAYASGIVGQAFNLDGAFGTYVEVPNTSVFNPAGAFSVDGWFYIDPAANQWKISTFVAKSEGSSGNGWALYYDDRSWTHDLKFIVGSNAVMTNAMPTPGWYHIAGVFDPAATPRTKLYLNGVKVADSGSQTGGPASNNYNVRIGAMNWADEYGGNDRLNGKADEVEFFSRALTAEEIAAIYNSGSTGKCRSCTPPPSNMLSWWRAEDDADDATGANNGTLMNGATFEDGKVGQAFSLDGIDDFVEVPNTPSLNIEAGDFSIGLWANYETIRSGFIWSLPNVFMGKDEGSGFQNKWVFASADDGLYLLTYSSGNHLVGPAAFSPVAGRWYYLALTRAGSVYAFYVDGMRVGAPINDPTPIPPVNASLIIGQAEGLGYFNGLLDEVEIFNRALSADEIAAIYNAGTAGKCAVFHNVNATAPGGNGTLSCTGPALDGYDSTCTVTPATGYYLSALTDNTADVLGSVTGGIYTISNVSAPHNVVATFTEYLVRRSTTIPVRYYNSIQGAYDLAGTGEIIQARIATFAGPLLLDQPVSVTLEGGYNSGFGSQGGYTTISTGITISNATGSGGAVTMENIIVQ